MQEISGTGEASAVGRSLSRYHGLRRSLKLTPKRIVQEYLADVEETLGIAPGQAYTLKDHNRRLPWRKHKTLQRLHFLLGEVLRLQLLGQHDSAMALVCQGLKSIHQSLLDNGGWKTAWLFTTLPDPCGRPRQAGREKETEIILSYATMIDRLEARTRAVGQTQTQPNNAPELEEDAVDQQEEADDQHDGGGKGAGKRGRGGRRGGAR